MPRRIAIDLPSPSATRRILAARRSPLQQSVQHAEALLAQQDFAGATEALRLACSRFPDAAPLWRLRSLSSWNAELYEEAVEAIEKAVLIEPQRVEFATQHAWMLWQLDDHASARKILQRIISKHRNCATAYSLLAQIFKSLGRWNEAADAAAGACRLDPTDFEMRETWAGSLLAADQPDKALVVIQQGLDLFREPEQRYQLLLQKARAHREIGGLNEAAAAMISAAESRAEEAVLEHVCELLFRAGRPKEAEEWRKRLHAMTAKTLPAGLEDALDQIWDGVDRIELDEEAVQWAWSLTDKTLWKESEWRRAAAWGHEAHSLLRRWWETAPKPELRQIEALIESADLRELHSALADGRACFVINAHVGPMPATAALLARANRPVHWFVSPTRGRLNDDTYLQWMPSGAHAVRMLSRQVRNGAIISMLGDEAYGRGEYAVDFLGRRIDLPGRLPKLLQMHNAASFWCCPLWRGKRIEFEFRPLPNPTEGEALEYWRMRWFDAYLQHLAGVMRGRPENLVLSSGVWANVNRTALRERRRRSRQHASR